MGGSNPIERIGAVSRRIRFAECPSSGNRHGRTGSLDSGNRQCIDSPAAGHSYTTVDFSHLWAFFIGH